MRSSECVMPVSESLKKQMHDIEPSANYLIVPNIVDLNKFYPACKQPDLEKLFKFLYIGQLDVANKQVDKIIKCFAGIVNDFQHVSLTIIGDGEDRNLLKELAEQYGLSRNCKFLGSQLHSIIAQTMREHHCLILFSVVETFSCVLAEAMASGIPVISSRCGGISEELLSEEGIVVDSASQGQLKEAMKKMIAEYHTFKPGKVRDSVNKYSPKAVSRAVIQEYEKCI